MMPGAWRNRILPSILFVLILSGTLVSSLHRLRHGNGDFHQFIEDGRLAIESGRLGAHLPLSYPPTARPLFMLFALPPPMAAAAAWWMCNVAAYWLAARWVAARAMPAGETLRAWSPLIVAGLGIVGLVADLSVGQLTGLVLFGCVASFEAMQRRRPLWAGLALAVPILVKPLPIVLLPYFALRRQWGVLAATLAAWLLLGPVLLALLFGAANQREGWRHFFADTAGPRAPWQFFREWAQQPGQMNTFRESGLAASLVRLGMPVTYDSAGRRVQVASCSADTLLAIWFAIVGGCMAAAAWIGWRDRPGSMRGFAAFIGVMLLANPKLIAYWLSAPMVPAAVVLGAALGQRSRVALVALAAWGLSMLAFALPACRAAGTDALGLLALTLGVIAVPTAFQLDSPRTQGPRIGAGVPRSQSDGATAHRMPSRKT